MAGNLKIVHLTVIVIQHSHKTFYKYQMNRYGFCKLSWAGQQTRDLFSLFSVTLSLSCSRSPRIN
jgi:hypothetical protein